MMIIQLLIILQKRNKNFLDCFRIIYKINRKGNIFIIFFIYLRLKLFIIKKELNLFINLNIWLKI